MYNQLKKIKRPVLIELESKFEWRNRFRILHPNGKCEYVQFSSERDYLNPSCFAYYDWDYGGKAMFYRLPTVISKMEAYDQHMMLKIVKIIEL